MDTVLLALVAVIVAILSFITGFVVRSYGSYKRHKRRKDAGLTRKPGNRRQIVLERKPKRPIRKVD